MKIETVDDPRPDEDFGEHERTFAFFLRMVAIAMFHVLACLLAVAIGGIFGRWCLGLFWFVIATLAAGLGIAVKKFGWKPGAAVLALTFVTFAVTA
jgi:hypothetical protein